MNKKPLREMTNEELWQLFPIILREHDDKWALSFAKEKALLLDNIDSDMIIRIDHVGSTAVKGLLAKPTVDILFVVKPFTSDTRELFIKTLEGLGYIYQYQPQRKEPKMMFMKGYTINGFADEVFHLHVRYQGDDDERYFCRYLQEHPEVANEYRALKTELAKKYEHDRDGYTDAKTAFVKYYTKLAKQAYRE